MKKIFSLLAAIAVAAGLSAGGAAAAAGNDPASYNGFLQSLKLSEAAQQVPVPAAPENGAPTMLFSRSAGKITVGINPNRELLYTILHLTAFSEKLRNGRMPALAAAALADLGKFKGHPAVAELDHQGALNWEKGFCYDAFSDYYSYFSDLPEGRRIYDYDDDFLARVLRGQSKAEKIAYLDAYWEKVRDFHKTAGFAGFFKKNAGLYQSYADSVYRNLPPMDAVKLHEDFHAEPGFEHFYIVPSPLNLPPGGSFGGRRGKSIFNHMGYGFNDGEAVKLLILHEFGHSFCNPVADKYAAELGKYGFLMEGLAADMKKKAYTTWQTVMDELLVRAVHARLLLRMDGKDAAELFLQREISYDKFVFIRDFYNLLEVYENDRGTYPTLYEFYPRLADALSNWELAEVVEPLNVDVWTTPVGETLVIDWAVPTGYGYAAGLRDRDTVTAVDGQKAGPAFFLTMENGRTYALSVTREDGRQETISLTTLSQRTQRPVRKPR
ncbi:MAG TPA: hypothetical protein DCZ93_05195 [Elusimicrobia bacterium]|nr:MAG: hypothetical protein A2X35_07365 [Elusimicrobia bacterium GWA2_61_42]OGR75031.1 MAG: hypothetical protein A2X38_01515 [Elusimicrobia bacterium GWC2_61_25]HBB66688.1 hypothetical protein [Elusimicrobiota bacterium]